MAVRLLSFLLRSYGMLVKASAIQEHNCLIFSWRSWGSCNGVCGHQIRSRGRVFCCNKSVQPHTIENCIEHCDFSSDCETLRNQTCTSIVCEHGATLSSLAYTCKCSLHHKGDYCQGSSHLKETFLEITFLVYIYWSFKNMYL